MKQSGTKTQAAILFPMNYGYTTLAYQANQQSTYCVRVKFRASLSASDRPAWVHLGIFNSSRAPTIPTLTYHTGDPQLHAEGASLGGYGEQRNANVLAVGAARYSTPGIIRSSSSRGPGQGILKPNRKLSAPTGLQRPPQTQPPAPVTPLRTSLASPLSSCRSIKPQEPTVAPAPVLPYSEMLPKSGKQLRAPRNCRAGATKSDWLGRRNPQSAAGKRGGRNSQSGQRRDLPHEVVHVTNVGRTNSGFVTAEHFPCRPGELANYNRCQDAKSRRPGCWVVELAIVG